MQEVLISSNRECIQVHDARTFTLYGTFSHHVSEKKTMDTGRILFSISNDHLISTFGPYFFAHAFAKEHSLYRSVMHTPLTAICASKDGLFYIGGNANGEISIWDSSTGECLRSFSAHYKHIRLLELVDDEFLVSISEDSTINIWSFGDLVDEKCKNITPIASCIDHSKPVSHLKSLMGGSKFISSSLDKSCRVWDASTGQCLITFFLPAPVTSAIMNPQETFLFCGCENGAIYRINIYPTIHVASSVIHTVSDNEITRVFGHHRKPVRQLCLSADSSLLFSAADDGEIVRWDVISGQCVGVLKSKDLAICCLDIIQKPVDLFSPSASGGHEVISCPPMRPGVSGKPVQSRIILHEQNQEDSLYHQSSYEQEDQEEEEEGNVIDAICMNGNNAVNEENARLKEENAKLQKMLAQAKQINLEMYKRMMDGSGDENIGK